MAFPSPKSLLRFMADNFDLLEKLCLFGSHTHGQVAELLDVFPPRERGFTPTDLVRIGILEVDETRGHYLVVGHIKAFVDRLLQRRNLVDSKLIEGAISDLNQLRESMEQALRLRAYSRLLDLVRNVQESVRLLKESVQANLEGIRTNTAEFRKAPPISSKERWRRIRELWDNYVIPMRDIFDTEGPLVEACDRLQGVLDQTSERGPSADQDDYDWAKHYLRRLGTEAFQTYLEAAREVQPLYDQAKRNAQVALSASAVIDSYWKQAIDRRAAIDESFWDREFGVMDPWEEDRTRKPFGTSIASWLAVAYYRRPNPSLEELVPPPKAFRVPLSNRLVEHRFLMCGGTTEDLLGWLRQEFPEAGLREVLRAYHFLLKTTDVTRGGPRRTICHHEAEITSYEVRGITHGTA